MPLRSLGAAAGPSLRTVLATPAVAVAALAALPAAVTVARGGHDLQRAIVAAAVLSGAAYAFAVDDPAEATLAASPSPVRTRLTLRVVAVTIAVASAWLVIAGCAWLAGAALGPLGPRAAEATAAAGVAITAGRCDPHRAAPDGLWGAIAAVVVLLGMTLVARHQPWLPTLGQSDQALGWWVVAAVAWLGAWWVTRDPAAGTPATGTRRSEHGDRRPRAR